MATTMLLGQPLADQMYNKIRLVVDRLKSTSRKVNIQAILVGQDSASISYLKRKGKMCQELGIKFSLLAFAKDEFAAVVEAIESANADPNITGLIVQLPLPPTWPREELLLKIDPHKDIDAFHYSLGPKNWPEIFPPTPAGMIALWQTVRPLNLKDEVAIVGHGLLVGQPLEKMLQEKGFSPHILLECESAQARAELKKADVIFTGVGQPDLIRPDMIKPGVVLIDAGFAKVNGQVQGDVDPACAKKAAALTPPVGGIGPLTVAYLLQNAVTLAEKGQDQ